MRRSFEKLLILYALKEEDLCTVLVKLPLLKMQIREQSIYRAKLPVTARLYLLNILKVSLFGKIHM